MIHQFIDNDEGYRDWLKNHPKGFIVNTTRTPNAGYLVLHRAECRTIQPRAGKHWTKEYIKVCSEHMNELESWAMNEIGGATHLCPMCFE